MMQLKRKLTKIQDGELQLRTRTPPNKSRLMSIEYLRVQLCEFLDDWLPIVTVADAALGSLFFACLVSDFKSLLK